MELKLIKKVSDDNFYYNFIPLMMKNYLIGEYKGNFKFRKLAEILNIDLKHIIQNFTKYLNVSCINNVYTYSISNSYKQVNVECRLLNYGNLLNKGLRVFEKMFEWIKENITYFYMYYASTTKEN